MIHSVHYGLLLYFFFFFQAEDGIRDHCVTGVQTCALPICPHHLLPHRRIQARLIQPMNLKSLRIAQLNTLTRSEEHTSELQSHSDLVCRLLLEKKKKTKNHIQKYHMKIHTTDYTFTPLEYH